jgi:Dolichyl-phosphate-mannose-protein mannosyltransferase
MLKLRFAASGLVRGDRESRGTVTEATLSTTRESVALFGLLLGTFVLRAVAADQPIVENYVGRQIPTAMVARNLERGSGFLRPQLETLPEPNLFLVEPPIYAAAVVGLRRATGLALGLGPSGRLVSAMATALAAWGLFGLVRRREGGRSALFAVAAFALFPLTIRYGRAFQPDALMLGTLVAGLRCWDEHEAGGSAGWLAAAVVLLVTGLALKIVSVYLLVPLISLNRRPPRRVKVALALGLVLPALAWYAHAAGLLREGMGSRASADNSAIWARVLIPSALLQVETLRDVVRFLGVRAFTPIGLALALWGLRGGDRFWKVWGAAALSALVFLAGKLHHEYYWLAMGPMAAVGIGRALAILSERRPVWAALAGPAMAVLALFQVRDTWQTPPRWAALPEAARAIRAKVPPGAWVVAPEALLYAADRRGCRLELAPEAVRRAAGEWGTDLEGETLTSIALVEFYRARGARFVADLGLADDRRASEPRRLALQEAIRRRYNVLVDRPGVLIAALNDPEPEPARSPDGLRK